MWGGDKIGTNRAAAVQFSRLSVYAYALQFGLKAAPLFPISNADAILIATKQVRTIKQRWSAVCDEVKLSQVDRNFFWRRQFLNPFAFLGSAGSRNKADRLEISSIAG